MIQITNKADCCGCTACASVCAHHAISMEPDAMGFLYPKIDTDKCTECGLCEKVCAFNPNYDKSLNLSEPQIYAARHKDIHEIETSRSGAAFIAISDYVLEQGGVVYGAGYAERFRVVHKRATNKEERNEEHQTILAIFNCLVLFHSVIRPLKILVYSTHAPATFITDACILLLYSFILYFRDRLL